ncbi:MAG TPA: 2-oxoglutarate and iron-dependent oxygenase domain-containing protein [Acidimicrobiales bacterium]|nr:2-oxoglutarate and iron-dependent oxygenase domain-containing protein [Acidimicrobiales bacterium]
MNGQLPVVDLTSADAAEAIDRACREVGFFYVVGHGVDESLQERLESSSRAFFARPDDVKAEIAMARGGNAWRGWFPVGGELTSGVPDRKEGIYFGAEEPPGDLPLRGPNLFPDDDLREAVLGYLDAMTALGHRLASLVGIDPEITRDPTILFRIFHYPAGGDGGWGVGEHTDYGLLTILRQDPTSGLQVKSTSGWIDAPPIPGSFVVNIGDMLERMTGGTYRSTPHRVRNTSDVGRLSFPFFFDPSWDAVVPVPEGAAGAVERWDGEDVLSWEGTYGEYLLGKVAKVFPELATRLPPAAGR